MTNFFNVIGVPLDVYALTASPKRAESHSENDGLDSLALSLSRQVERGQCDPLAAEALLSDHIQEPRTDFTDTKAGERGSVALERLTLIGALDPVFAEQVLDQQFSRFSVVAALHSIERSK